MTLEEVALRTDTDLVPLYPSRFIRAALFQLFLHGQLQFWREDGPWTEPLAHTVAPTRRMGEIHYALAPNHEVSVHNWMSWHGNT